MTDPLTRYLVGDFPVVSRPVRCAVTELEVIGCAHCRQANVIHDKMAADYDPPSASMNPLARALGRWFPARYSGRCSQCDDRFHEDDEIRADGEGGYLCTNCGEEAER